MANTEHVQLTERERSLLDHALDNHGEYLAADEDLDAELGPAFDSLVRKLSSAGLTGPRMMIAR